MLMNNKNKASMFTRVLAIFLAALMIFGVATYTIFALMGLM